MSPQAVVDLYVTGLTEGLPHPDGKPRVLMGYRPSLHAPEIAEKIRAETRGLAEALAHHIETSGWSFVPTAEIEQLRAAQDALAPTVDTPAVWCSRPGCGCKEPLMSLVVTDPKRLTTDGPTFITAMSSITPECPHGPRR